MSVAQLVTYLCIYLFMYLVTDVISQLFHCFLSKNWSSQVCV